MSTKRWVLLGLGGAGGLLWLGVLTVGAVTLSTWFVVLYAQKGPIPGRTVARPVESFGTPPIPVSGERAPAAP